MALGNRAGDRPEQPERRDRSEQPDRPERRDRSEQPDRPERSEETDQPDRPDRRDRRDRRGSFDADTAAAIVRGIAGALQDKGVSTAQARPTRDPWQSWPLRISGALPAGVRRSLLARLVVAQAVPPARLDAIDLQAVASRTVRRYGAPNPSRRSPRTPSSRDPSRDPSSRDVSTGDPSPRTPSPRTSSPAGDPRTPSVPGFPGLVIGSADGALAHLCALTGMPWLPQTHTLVVKWTDGDPDDAVSAADFGRRVLPALRDANPDVTLHQSHDANQDRLVAGRVAYVRAKWVRLPEAYVRMIRHHLEPGAPIVILDDTARWPVTELAERLVLQAGGYGGLQAEDYLDGSSRVAEFLRRQGSTRSRFAAPEATRHAPDAEWGYDPQLTDAIVALGKETGHPVVRLSVSSPQQLAGPVADLARTRLRASGGAGDRLLVESAAQLNPMAAERAGLVPYWTFLPVQPGRHAVAGYLERAAGSSDRLSEAYVLMHPCGLETCGVARPDEWLGLADHLDGRIVLQPGIAERWPTHADTPARLGRWLRSIPSDPGLPDGPLPLVPVEEALAAVATGEVGRDDLA